MKSYMYIRECVYMYVSLTACLNKWMNAWINERMTEWLFFFRLKTKNLIKTKSQTNRQWGDSNWQTLNHWILHSASETTEDVMFETGLAGYMYLTWIGQRDRPLRWQELCGFESHPGECFFACRQVFHIGGCLYVYVCMNKWKNDWMAFLLRTKN